MSIGSKLYLYLGVERTCNLRCKHCHIWMNKNTDDILTTDQLVRIVDEFGIYCRTNNKHGHIVFTEGEVLVNKLRAQAVFRACRRHKLTTILNSNGTLFDEYTVNMVHRLAINMVIISLDSHIPEVHDDWRGIVGTHAKASKAVSDLVRISGSKGRMSVHVNMTIRKGNIDHLIDTAKYVHDLGAYGFNTQLLTPTFANKNHTDKHYDEQWFHTEDEKKYAKEKLQEADVFIKTTKLFKYTQLDNVQLFSYLDGNVSTTTQVCDSAAKNIIVSPFGDVALCFGQVEHFKDINLGTVKQNSLSGILNSQTVHDLRISMATCRELCGTLNCHRKHDS